MKDTDLSGVSYGMLKGVLVEITRISNELKLIRGYNPERLRQIAESISLVESEMLRRENEAKK